MGWNHVKAPSYLLGSYALGELAQIATANIEKLITGHVALEAATTS